MFGWYKSFVRFITLDAALDEGDEILKDLEAAIRSSRNLANRFGAGLQHHCRTSCRWRCWRRSLAPAKHGHNREAQAAPHQLKAQQTDSGRVQVLPLGVKQLAAVNIDTLPDRDWHHH